MSSRVNWYHRQRVAENELDLAFDQLEQADHNLASDVGIYGIVSGGVAVPHQSVPDLRVDVSGPTKAYDRLGRRVFVPTMETVDCSIDANGMPTVVATAGKSRWVSVFIRFSRLLSDLRRDGGNQDVFFRRDEHFEFVVRQGPEAPAGTAPRPPLEPDELLVCDVRRTHGQTQIVAADIDEARRQRFVFAQAENVAVLDGGFEQLAPAEPTVQAALDAVDHDLFAHLEGTGNRHSANAIDAAPHGFLTAPTVQGALDQLVDTLQSSTTGTAGSSRVGADAVPGSPYVLPQGTVDSQLSTGAANLNNHATSTTAHAASSITASAHAFVSSTTVQGQLQELVTDLAATAAGTSGAERVGGEAIAGSPTAIAAGAVRAQLSSLLSALNAHANLTAGAHPAQAITVADTGDRLAAGTVEAAIAEALQGFEGDHFRQNESAAGQHRTIRQPVLGTDVALLWDALGIGQAAGRMRVYSDGAGIWITLNAAMTGDSWTKDANGSSSALHLSKAWFELMNHTVNTAMTFTAWTKSWSLGMSSTICSTWLVTGPIQDTGRVGLEAVNTSNASASVSAGASINFRVRFSTAPSSVTLSNVSSTGVTGMPVVSSIDTEGCHVSHTQNLAANSALKWLGRYTVVA